MAEMLNADLFLAHRKEQESTHFYRAEQRGGPLTPIDALQAVEVNVTELCNRTCEFCPRAHGYPNQNINMTPERGAFIAKQLAEGGFTGRISFSGFGEAILNKDFPAIIAAFRKALPHADIETNTNGDRLTVESIKELFAAGLSLIYVNLYDGEEQAKAFERLFHLAGEDNYILRPHWQGAESSWGLKLTNRGGSIPIKTLRLLPVKRACYYPFYKLFIDHDGSILACCNDWKREKRLGNIFTQSLEAIWTGAEMEALRAKLAEGKRTEKPCSSCDADGMAYGARSFQALRVGYWKKRILAMNV